MFQDISVGKTLIMEYGQYCENQQVTGIGSINLHRIICKIFVESLLVDFSAMVLSSNSWPFSAPTNFVLPIEVCCFMITYLDN
jgi:hypothetical protein